MRKILSNTWMMAVTFAAAAVLIVTGGISVARAAPKIRSEYFGMQIELTDIETALVENGQIVEGDNVLLGYDTFLKPNGLQAPSSDGDDAGVVPNFVLGKAYKEIISVRNVGRTDEYVRLTLRKYWVDESGKRVNLDPSLIELHLVDGSGWTLDEAASTPERLVLYYDSILAAGSDTPAATDTFTIGSSILSCVTDEVNDYQNVNVRIEAEVDAVQTHSGEEAMRSVWGRTNV